MYPIYQTLSNVQSGDAVQLQQSIDNSKGALYVGLDFNLLYKASGEWFDTQLPFTHARVHIN